MSPESIGIQNRVEANEVPVSPSAVPGGNDTQPVISWTITSTLDLNRLFDQIVGTSGNVVNSTAKFIKEAIKDFGNYYQVLSVTIPAVPLHTNLHFWFSNADRSATLRYAGLIQSAEWNSSANTIVDTRYIVDGTGKQVIIVDHFNDNGLAEFALRVWANGNKIVNVNFKEDDGLAFNRRRLFIFKFDVAGSILAESEDKSHNPKTAKQVNSLLEKIQGERATIKLDGQDFGAMKTRYEKFAEFDKDLKKQILDKIEEAAREAQFRREVLANELTRQGGQEFLPIHFSVEISTSDSWCSIDWARCSDKNCEENAVFEVDVEPKEPAQPHSAKIPHLTEEQKQAVFIQLQEKFPSMSNLQFEKLLSNQHPLQKPEFTSDVDTERCIALAKEVLDAALEAANTIKNPVAKTFAILAAKWIFVLAEIQCISEYAT